MPGGAGKKEKDGMLSQVRCPCTGLPRATFTFPMVFSVVCDKKPVSDPALYAPVPPRPPPRRALVSLLMRLCAAHSDVLALLYPSPINPPHPQLLSTPPNNSPSERFAANAVRGWGDDYLGRLLYGTAESEQEGRSGATQDRPGRSGVQCKREAVVRVPLDRDAGRPRKPLTPHPPSSLSTSASHKRQPMLIRRRGCHSLSWRVVQRLSQPGR